MSAPATYSVAACVVTQCNFLVCRNLIQFGDQFFNRQCFSVIDSEWPDVSRWLAMRLERLAG